MAGFCIFGWLKRKNIVPFDNVPVLDVNVSVRNHIF